MLSATNILQNKLDENGGKEGALKKELNKNKCKEVIKRKSISFILLRWSCVFVWRLVSSFWRDRTWQSVQLWRKSASSFFFFLFYSSSPPWYLSWQQWSLPALFHLRHASLCSELISYIPGKVTVYVFLLRKEDFLTEEGSACLSNSPRS